LCLALLLCDRACCKKACGRQDGGRYLLSMFHLVSFSGGNSDAPKISLARSALKLRFVHQGEQASMKRLDTPEHVQIMARY
jgi:hypothetical protein